MGTGAGGALPTEGGDETAAELRAAARLTCASAWLPGRGVGWSCRRGSAVVKWVIQAVRRTALVADRVVLRRRWCERSLRPAYVCGPVLRARAAEALRTDQGIDPDDNADGSCSPRRCFRRPWSTTPTRPRGSRQRPRPRRRPSCARLSSSSSQAPPSRRESLPSSASRASSTRCGPPTAFFPPSAADFRVVQSQFDPWFNFRATKVLSKDGFYVSGPSSGGQSGASTH